jgi:glycosyltransferase involved in cell wall biosynthesis
MTRAVTPHAVQQVDRAASTHHVDRPLVSVCFPTTGRMTYLSRALAALEAQTYPRVETLVLDNASEGEAPAVLREFAGRRADTRILRVETRVPMFANFNRGIQAARGTYVVFFHDDDEYSPEFLERMVSLLERYPNAAFAGGNYDVIDDAGLVSRSNRLIARTERWTGRRFITELVRRGRSPISTPGIVFRRDALAIEGFDPGLPMNWGDFTMLMRLAERGDVVMDAQPMYSWRVHGANASNVAFGESIPLRTEVFSRYRAEYAARHPEDGAFVAWLGRAIRRAHVKGLVWGWLSAPHEDDAVACRRLLGRSSWMGRVLSLLLAVPEHLGLSLARRRALVPAIRRLAARGTALRSQVTSPDRAECAE